MHPTHSTNAILEFYSKKNSEQLSFHSRLYSVFSLSKRRLCSSSTIEGKTIFNAISFMKYAINLACWSYKSKPLFEQLRNGVNFQWYLKRIVGYNIFLSNFDLIVMISTKKVALETRHDWYCNFFHVKFSFCLVSLFLEFHLTLNGAKRLIIIWA